MKSFFSIGLMLALMSVSSLSMATSSKIVRSDRIVINLPQAAAEKKKIEKIQRTDRVKLNVPVMEQPQLKPKRIVRSDRIVVNKV